jgi:hypothetical protein
MTDTQPDRPADLRMRRRPQPASDERVDPVDYRQELEPASEPVAASTNVAAPGARARVPENVPQARIRTRREVTIPFSTRLTPDVLELIDDVVAAGKASGEGPQTQRAVVEQAIRHAYGGR